MIKAKAVPKEKVNDFTNQEKIIQYDILL